MVASSIVRKFLWPSIRLHGYLLCNNRSGSRDLQQHRKSTKRNIKILTSFGMQPGLICYCPAESSAF